ncbi:MAG: type II toxin-antitoxin system Phd/YefM family antitoxin [Deltaproteobacteria bacterium]|nr:type II toxin-antitoxin system Phd/YefM family antitoxin [Deltaproteobacteria bacterium]
MKQVDVFMPVSDARNRLLALIRGVGTRDEVVALTRDGIPAAVVLSPNRYEGLLETIEILSDPAAMKSLRRSIRQARRGEWVKDDEVFGKGTP